jgi:uncharacterized protein with NRDE domain
MCLIGVALDATERYSCILAANRDESFDRPALTARWWCPNADSSVRVLSGRDSRAGGTWLGVNEKGQLAAITNIRMPAPLATPQMSTPEPSRGDLPLIALLGGAKVLQQHLEANLPSYKGFNLLRLELGSASHVRLDYQGSQSPLQTFRAGVHVLSNASINTSWPKSDALRLALCGINDRNSTASVEANLLSALQDQQIPADERLPDTGVGLARERLLAPAFIRAPGYGTRVSTVVTQERTSGKIRFIEVTWDTASARPEPEQWRSFEFLPVQT